MKRILTAATIAAALLAHVSSAHADDTALLAGGIEIGRERRNHRGQPRIRKDLPGPMPAHLTLLYDNIVKEGDYDDKLVAKMTKKYEREAKAQGVAKWCRSLAEMLLKG